MIGIFLLKQKQLDDLCAIGPPFIYNLFKLRTDTRQRLCDIQKIQKILWLSHELYAMIWIKVKPSEGGECVLPKSSYNSVSGTFECQRINYGMYHWNKCSEELSASYLYFFQRQKKKNAKWAGKRKESKQIMVL